MKRWYYFTFRQSLQSDQATLYVERAPTRAYAALKAAGFFVAYGREGDKPTKDSHPGVHWDNDAPDLIHR